MNSKLMKVIREIARNNLDKDCEYRTYNERTFHDSAYEDSNGEKHIQRKWFPITLAKDCLRAQIKYLKKVMRTNREARIG